MQKDVIGRGWPFPLRPDQRGKLRFISGSEKIRQSLWILLSTSPGERQMMPDYGCGIHDLVFEANTAALRGILQGKIRDALARWEPRIDVLDIHVDTEPDAPNSLLIHIDYRIRADNSLYNLVFPFFLTEGVG